VKGEGSHATEFGNSFATSLNSSDAYSIKCSLMKSLTFTDQIHQS
jgi:hypothetical protein